MDVCSIGIGAAISFVLGTVPTVTIAIVQAVGNRRERKDTQAVHRETLAELVKANATSSEMKAAITYLKEKWDNAVIAEMAKSGKEITYETKREVSTASAIAVVEIAPSTTPMWVAVNPFFAGTSDIPIDQYRPRRPLQGTVEWEPDPTETLPKKPE
jgi:NCAIR mutase (PurE)-related protein